MCVRACMCILSHIAGIKAHMMTFRDTYEPTVYTHSTYVHTFLSLHYCIISVYTCVNTVQIRLGANSRNDLQIECKWC